MADPIDPHPEGPQPVPTRRGRPFGIRPDLEQKLKAAMTIDTGLITQSQTLGGQISELNNIIAEGLNDTQRDLWDSQVGINALLNERIDLHDIAILELREMIESNKGESWAVVTIGPNGTVDDFTTTYNGLKITLTVGGTWSGRIIATITYETGPTGERSDVQEAYTWDVAVNRTFEVTHTATLTPKFIRLDYRTDPNQVIQSNLLSRNISLDESLDDANPNWVTLHEVTIPEETEVIASMRVGWHAATFQDLYGIRIIAGENVIGIDGPRRAVGPRTFFENGYRIMNLSDKHAIVPAGTVVKLQAMSGADHANQRQIRDATLRIAHILEGQTTPPTPYHHQH